MADSILTMENISKSYTGRMVLNKADFYLQQGEKVGIIGINGTGKSTLLRLISGIEEPDNGSIVIAKNTIIRFLPQDLDYPEGTTVIDAVTSADRFVSSVSTSGKIISRISDVTADDKSIKDDEYWTRLSDAKSMLTRLGIYNFDQPVSELSGGQRKCLAIVSVLLYPSEILVMDEPTNHLDQETSQWLEDQLKSHRGALVLVTHDRYFLDSVTSRIIEIDKGNIYSYDTNYSGYIELKMQREEQMISSEAKRQNILRKELAWIRRGARARSTKQKAHIQRYEALRDQEAPIFDQKVQLESISSRMGKTTVELEHICKSYGNTVLINDFSYNFLKTDRVGFVGANGAGKTTLLKMIMGMIQPDFGRITIGQTIRIGYFSQELETEEKDSIAYMDPQTTVINYIKDIAEYVNTNDGRISASRMLERFLFTPEMQYSRIEKLSGGERRRLNLLRVLMQAPNVLLLDEPTNDLDIATLSILEDYLDTFAGIVITVSHDRYFLDRVVSRIFAFEGNGKIVQYEGGWTEYSQKRPKPERNFGSTSYSAVDVSGIEADHAAASKISATAIGSGSDSDASNMKGSERSRNHKLKFSFNEKREYETIEADIALLEDKIASLEKEIAANSSDFVKLQKLSAQKDETEAALLEKMERWEYLEELAQAIDAQQSR